MVGEVGPGPAASCTEVAPLPQRRRCARPTALHWDVLGLYREVARRAARGRRPRPEPGRASASTRGRSTTGCSRDGRLLGNPFHYRDERRAPAWPSRCTPASPPTELYARNGLQFLPFNTLYQLAADRLDVALDADRLLLIPDLLGYWLTGRRGRRAHQRLDHRAARRRAPASGTTSWSTRLGLPAGAAAAAASTPATIVGTLLPEVGGRRLGAPGRARGRGRLARHRLGGGRRPAGRATTSAYISCGTWVAGRRSSSTRRCSPRRRGAANFTNEGGVDGTIRFLQQRDGALAAAARRMRTWERDGHVDLADLLAAAADVTGRRSPVFDVDDPRFLPPGDMPARIARLVRRARRRRRPRRRPTTVRCILESLAAGLRRRASARAGALAGRAVDVVHVVGGGARNDAAVPADRRRVRAAGLAGPVEATALGNVLVQARAARRRPAGPRGDARAASRRPTSCGASSRDPGSAAARLRRMAGDACGSR